MARPIMSSVEPDTITRRPIDSTAVRVILDAAKIIIWNLNTNARTEELIQAFTDKDLDSQIDEAIKDLPPLPPDRLRI
jgi:hypothetical protein